MATHLPDRPAPEMPWHHDSSPSRPQHRRERRPAWQVFNSNCQDKWPSSPQGSTLNSPFFPALDTTLTFKVRSRPSLRVVPRSDDGAGTSVPIGKATLIEGNPGSEPHAALESSWAWVRVLFCCRPPGGHARLLRCTSSPDQNCLRGGLHDLVSATLPALTTRNENTHVTPPFPGFPLIRSSQRRSYPGGTMARLGRAQTASLPLSAFGREVP